MLIDNTRKKLINIIIYFIENTQNCNECKLIKLLFLFDFEHYTQTGRSVTGLDYMQFYTIVLSEKLTKELVCPPDDFKQSFKFTYNGLIIEPIIPFSDDFLTKRELKILKELSEKFKFLDDCEIIANIKPMINDEYNVIDNYLEYL